jgi:hypothetical protein
MVTGGMKDAKNNDSISVDSEKKPVRKPFSQHTAEAAM